MIALKDFSIGYRGRALVEKADATFGTGQLTALIGRNGAGKSTLLRAIAGLNTRYTGSVTIGGIDRRALDRPEAARRVAFVSTERVRIPSLRCRDIVALGRAPYTDWAGNLGDADRAIVAEALRAVGMADYACRTMDTMSDGECQRIMIARALAQHTPVLLLDEPTSFLDMPGRYELASLLASLAHDEGKCVVFSTHELDVALHTCDTIALIDHGRLYHLPPDRMVADGHIDRLFGKHVACGM